MTGLFLTLLLDAALADFTVELYGKLSLDDVKSYLEQRESSFSNVSTITTTLTSGAAEADTCNNDLLVSMSVTESCTPLYQLAPMFGPVVASIYAQLKADSTSKNLNGGMYVHHPAHPFCPFFLK